MIRKQLVSTLSVVALATLGLVAFAMGDDGQEPVKENVEREARKADVQQICPVSGERLGGHGDPIKVRIGEEVLFVCCKGCEKGKVKPEHWATIHSNFAKAQKICPVMEKPLPQKPKWTIVEGQIFYLCCPPCEDKINDDPEAFLTKLDELYKASLEK